MRKWVEKEKIISLFKDGQSIFVGGFLTCGTPEYLIDLVIESKVKNLTIICNDGGMPDKGVGRLIANHQVKKLIASHIGTNPEVGKRMSEQTLDVELVPQGTLIERIRAYGAGLGGILTPTGFKTIVEEKKQVLYVQNKPFLLEEALGADVALVLAQHADHLGNLTYSKTTRNFNPIIATAAKHTIVEVRTKKETIDPEHVITPHIFVNYMIQKEGQ